MEHIDYEGRIPACEVRSKRSGGGMPCASMPARRPCGAAPASPGSAPHGRCNNCCSGYRNNYRLTQTDLVSR